MRAEDDSVEPLLLDDGVAKRLKNRRGSNQFATSQRRYRCVVVALVAATLFLFVLFAYENSVHKLVLPGQPRPMPAPVQLDFVTYDDIMGDNFEFRINGSDVMVFLHVQKTGGTTFGKHLVNDIDLESPCRCRAGAGRKRKKQQRRRGKLRCDCFRPRGASGSGGRRTTWLFSRYSTGWKCGLHPDWTELTECVDGYLDAVETPAERRYFYITFLRNPVDRYLSEFRHVQRGATWKAARNACNGRPATKSEIPPCYDSDDWSDVDLGDFMSCPSNLATNRQTRMLADLRLVGCYDTTGMSAKARDMVMLDSAKANLEKMAFFGLTEEQAASQAVFQRTFNMNFRRPFVQHNESRHSSDVPVDRDTIDAITELNHLDVELYEFAKALMRRRYEEASKA